MTTHLSGPKGDGSLSVHSSGAAFTTAKAEGRAALVGYLPVGYPSVAGSLEALRVLCGADGATPGVDLVEIGLPYSDPVMDGPVIQRAGTKALERGVRTAPDSSPPTSSRTRRTTGWPPPTPTGWTGSSWCRPPRPMRAWSPPLPRPAAGCTPPR